MFLLKTALLLASVDTFVAASPGSGNNSWTKKQCSDRYIDDAGAPAAARWNAADAEDAWNAVTLAWY
jgi:hypothetical protein